MKKLIFFLIIFTSFVSSCKKEKAQTGFVGHWLIQSQFSQSQFSGEMFLSKEGEGSIVVYNTSKDTQFYRDIYSFDIIDHSAEFDFTPGRVKSHWYQAYMNDDIYCNFRSSNEGDIVNEQTRQIDFHISSLIDNNTGQSTEVYDLNLLLTRD